MHMARLITLGLLGCSVFFANLALAVTYPTDSVEVGNKRLTISTIAGAFVAAASRPLVLWPFGLWGGRAA
jgi:hypothetical protein